MCKLSAMHYGPHYSIGCREALAILKRRGRGARAALARELRRGDGEPLDAGTLANILSGRRPMSLPLALQFKERLDVDPEAWTKPAKVRAVEAGR